MTTEETVSARIAAAFPDLSRRQKQVARFVAGDECFVAFASTADIAERASVSTATVVRFCRAIGYEGYTHLQAAIRQSLPHFRTTVQRLEDRLTSPVAEDDLLAQVFATDVDNIERMAGSIDPVTFEAAVAETCRATGIVVTGGGVASPPALFLAHSLKVMGFPVHVVTTGGVALSLELSTLRPSDLLVGVGFWRYLRETVETMRQAGEIGAKVIAITDTELSPLAGLADYAFVAPTDGVDYSISPVAHLSFINAFVATLSRRRPRQTLIALQKVDVAYRRSRLLLEE